MSADAHGSKASGTFCPGCNYTFATLLQREVGQALKRRSDHPSGQFHLYALWKAFDEDVILRALAKTVVEHCTRNKRVIREAQRASNSWYKSIQIRLTYHFNRHQQLEDTFR